jgi:iron(III) transport system permease protein
VIVLAYTIRFLAVSLGALEAGFERLSPNLDAVPARWARRRCRLVACAHAAAGAGAGRRGAAGVRRRHEGAARHALLRPFNFETLATHVYSYAALEQFERRRSAP